MASSDQRECPLPIRLKIHSRKRLRQFLKDVLPQFLQLVDPRESGLLDSLQASHLLTDTDNESMAGRDVLTRKDQARKLWVLLNKLSVEDFLSKVAPELCSKFPHIIPEAYLTTSIPEQEVTQSPESHATEVCVLHVIKTRVRVASMADLLYHRGCLDFESYETIISGKLDSEAAWTSIFEALRVSRGEEEREILGNDLEKLFQRHSLSVPDLNLMEVLSRGLRCTCKLTEACSPPASVLGSYSGEKVGQWLTQSRFSRARSLGSSRTWDDFSSRDANSTITTLHHEDTRSTSSFNSTSSESSTLVAAIPTSTSAPTPSPCLPCEQNTYTQAVSETQDPLQLQVLPEVSQTLLSQEVSHSSVSCETGRSVMSLEGGNLREERDTDNTQCSVRFDVAENGNERNGLCNTLKQKQTAWFARLKECRARCSRGCESCLNVFIYCPMFFLLFWIGQVIVEYLWEHYA